jgi:hypothetical protein
MSQLFTRCLTRGGLSALMLGGAIAASFVAVPQIAQAQATAPVAAPTPAAPDDWATIAPANQGFTIALPSQPQVSRGTMPIEADTMATTTYTVTDRSGVYVVMVMEMPVSLDPNSNLARTALDSGINGAIKSMSAKQPIKIVSRQSLTLKGYPGNEVSFHFQNQPSVIGKMRYFLVNNRVYGMAAVTNNRQSAIDQFITSFQLTLPSAATTRTPSPSPSTDMTAPIETPPGLVLSMTTDKL